MPWVPHPALIGDGLAVVALTLPVLAVIISSGIVNAIDLLHANQFIIIRTLKANSGNAQFAWLIPPGILTDRTELRVLDQGVPVMPTFITVRSKPDPSWGLPIGSLALRTLYRCTIQLPPLPDIPTTPAFPYPRITYHDTWFLIHQSPLMVYFLLYYIPFVKYFLIRGQFQKKRMCNFYYYILKLHIKIKVEHKKEGLRSSISVS